MNLDHFIYFKTLAQSNSFTLASERLFITQQALSKSMKAFEKELGTTLFLRSKQGISLTADGEYVLQIANRVLDATNELQHHFASSHAKNIRGSLDIMSLPIIQDFFISKTLINFYKYYPQIKINYQLRNEAEILSALQKKETHLGFLHFFRLQGAPLIEINDPLSFIPLMNSNISAIVSKKSPLAKLESLSLQQLTNQPIVIFVSDELKSSNTYNLLKNFGAQKFYPVKGYALYSQMIADNIGISIKLDQFSQSFSQSISGSVPNCVNIPISNDIDAVFGYVYNKEYADNPCIKLFLNEFLK